MNRRNFLKLGASLVKKEAMQAPKALAKIPKSTVSNVRQYDKLASDIKKKGNLVTSRRSFLDKAKKRTAITLIKNPKETTYRVKQGAKMVIKGAKLATSTPTDLALKTDGRKLKGLSKLLGMFSKKYKWFY